MSSVQGSQELHRRLSDEETSQSNISCIAVTDTCTVTIETSEEIVPTTSSSAFDCDMCSASFTTRDFLNRHRRYGHARRNPKGQQSSQSGMGSRKETKEQPPFVCDICKRSFTRRNARTSHVRIHARTGYECKDCGRRFSNSSHLSRHRRTHLGVSEDFLCPECWTGFNRKDVMQRHMLSHTGERPYACRVCGDMFTQRVGARRHEKNSHGVE
ncbi:endothelial zinc finger protein induced by tumor necrosis factor alpha-like isoform X1 [Dermacentor albipictus]|uniref:endothelial zinc finger protein induced by tumor necrosis factor alpha-like isoform X1 n=1 Tax=Dermacentor albipictus TaxID=60249 RepID=UPI0038FC5205